MYMRYVTEYERGREDEMIERIKNKYRTARIIEVRNVAEGNYIIYEVDESEKYIVEKLREIREEILDRWIAGEDVSSLKELYLQLRQKFREGG
jgi:DNA-directed RNA polymerase subunit K/omega